MTAADDRQVTTAPTVSLLLDEVGAWTKKYERLRLLVAAELGLPDFDALAAAERGYRRAVERLRDDERYRNWWSQLPPDHPEARYWDLSRKQLADYLEAVEGDDR